MKPSGKSVSLLLLLLLLIATDKLLLAPKAAHTLASHLSMHTVQANASILLSRRARSPTTPSLPQSTPLSPIRNLHPTTQITPSPPSAQAGNPDHTPATGGRDQMQPHGQPARRVAEVRRTRSRDSSTPAVMRRTVESSSVGAVESISQPWNTSEDSRTQPPP
jgi:hypothetical protein